MLHLYGQQYRRMVARNAKAGDTEIGISIFFRENLGRHSRYSRRRLGPDNAQEVSVVVVVFFIISNRYNMLHFVFFSNRNNVGYASTCNSTGQVMGIMISSVFSVLLTSEDFSNKYLRIEPGVGGVFTMKCKRDVKPISADLKWMIKKKKKNVKIKNSY